MILSADDLRSRSSRLFVHSESAAYANGRGVGRSARRGSRPQCGQSDRGSDARGTDAASCQLRQRVFKLAPFCHLSLRRLPKESAEDHDEDIFQRIKNKNDGKSPVHSERRGFLMYVS